MNELLLKAIEPMLTSRLRNYIVPGLTSELVGDGDRCGKVRLFTATRAATDFITPHSHRFHFTALVLAGLVKNTLFQGDGASAASEEWCASTITRVCGANGIEKFEHNRSADPVPWVRETAAYGPGQAYRMMDYEIHSVQFARGTKVLLFEGPPTTTRSVMLEPWCDGAVVPTFKVEPWMFLRDE